jgi:hypothetical protein
MKTDKRKCTSPPPYCIVDLCWVTIKICFFRRLNCSAILSRALSRKVIRSLKSWSSAFCRVTAFPWFLSVSLFVVFVCLCVDMAALIRVFAASLSVTSSLAFWFKSVRFSCRGSFERVCKFSCFHQIRSLGEFNFWCLVREA